MCSIQFLIMITQTNVLVNALGKNFVEDWREFEILPEYRFSRFSKIPPKGGREKRRNGAQPQNEILRKGVWGLCHQQAKIDFRRSRRKSVLSICGYKCPACKVATGSKI
jgi:hypothetical protein